VYLQSRQLTATESVYLDLFKVLMLIEVVLGHAVALCIPRYSELDLGSLSGIMFTVIRAMSGFGREAAFQFIFLSGFFTAITLLNFGCKFDLIAVLAKRLRRLYPVLVLALMVTALLDYLGAYLWHFPIYTTNGLNYSIHEHWEGKLLLFNLLSLQPTFSLTFGSNGPLWTLGYLIQFFMLGSILRWLSGANLILFVVLVIAALGITGPALGWEPSLLFMIWIIGVFVRIAKVTPLSYLNIWALIGSSIFLLALARLSPVLISILLTPLIGACLIDLATRLSKNNLPLLSTVIKQASQLSFAAYAVHMPVLFFWLGAIQSVIYTQELSGFTISIFIFSSFFLVVLSAYGIQLISTRFGGTASHAK
jgi:peptidoglycan/LPS O-acetylase OafA/YrhL